MDIKSFIFYNTSGTIKKNYLIHLLVYLLFYISIKNNAIAWENHSLITSMSLKNSTLINERNLVKAEKLENFLKETAFTLPDTLKNIETWADNRNKQYQYAFYPKLPESLLFNSSASDPNIVKKFMHAIRVNPNLKLPLFLQVLPGETIQDQSKVMNISEIILPKLTESAGKYTFIKVTEGQFLNPLDVLVTATDEPDYGLDIDLFEDNIKEFKVNYNFGVQPFGNPNFSSSSQAPFHMGYYHLSPLIYKSAVFLKKTYAEYRIKMFLELSHFAFKQGHSYWGFRFLGWSLHYIQDLTQPFHATPLPGYSTSDLIALNILDSLEGAFWKTHKKMNNAIYIISNRHFILEKLAYDSLFQAKNNKDIYSPIVVALQNESHDLMYPIANEDYTRETVSKESSTSAYPTQGSILFWRFNNDVSAIMSRSFPYKYVFDPTFIYDHSFNALEVLNNQPNDVKEKMLNTVNNLMENTGSHTRNIVKYAMSISSF